MSEKTDSGSTEGVSADIDNDPGDTNGDTEEIKNTPEKPNSPDEESTETEASVLVMRRFMIEVFSHLYALLLVALGIVLPIAIFLSGGNFRKHGVHLAIFHFYIYIGGTVFFVYFILLFRKKEEIENESPEAICDRDEGVNGNNQILNESQKATDDDFSSGNKTNEHEERLSTIKLPAIYETLDGVNFFLRMGLIAFGLGGVLLDGVRLVEFVQMHAMWECYGSAHLAAVAFRLVFVMVQTFSLFKYHSAGVNVHKALVKFGLLHNVATNLATWATMVVIEAVEAYNHSIHHQEKRDVATNGTDSNSNRTDNDSAYSAAVCIAFPNTLSTVASPYLFPFIIEYSLLSAAILYRMHFSVGPVKYYEARVKTARRASDREGDPAQEDKQSRAIECSKANTGLFMGLSVLIAVAIGVCFYLYLSTQQGMDHTVGAIYVSSDLVVKTLTLVTLVPTYWQIMKLHFSDISHDLLDQNLLILALFGTYLLDGFSVVAAIAKISADDTYITRSSRMVSASCFLNFLQVTLLTAFIIDGLHRRSVSKDHIAKKPGRSFVTFLLLLNIALWLISTFEMKMVHRFSIFYSYYGQLGWSVIVSVTGPLAIYFRFHCAVCLSDIWIEAYRMEPMGKILYKDPGKCGKLL